MNSEKQTLTINQEVVNLYKNKDIKFPLIISQNHLVFKFNESDCLYYECDMNNNEVEKLYKKEDYVLLKNNNDDDDDRNIEPFIEPFPQTFSKQLFIDKDKFNRITCSFENNKLVVIENITCLKNEYNDKLQKRKYELILKTNIAFEFANNLFIHPNYLGVEVLPFKNLLKKYNLINTDFEKYIDNFNKDGFITFNNLNSFLNRQNKKVDLSWIKYKDIYPYINEDISLNNFKIKYNITDKELNIIDEYLNENNFAAIGFNLLKAIKIISPKYKQFFLNIIKKNTRYQTESILYTLAILAKKDINNIEQIVDFAINETNYNFQFIIDNYSNIYYIKKYYINKSFETFNYEMTQGLLKSLNINEYNQKLVYELNKKEPLIAIMVSHKSDLTTNEKQLIADILNDKDFDKDVANQMLLDSGLINLVEKRASNLLYNMKVEFYNTQDILKIITGITEFDIWDTLTKEVYNQDSFILHPIFYFRDKTKNLLSLFLSLTDIASLSEEELMGLSEEPFVNILKYSYRKKNARGVNNINGENIDTALKTIFNFSLLERDKYINKNDVLITDTQEALKRILIDDNIFNKIFSIPKVDKLNITKNDLTLFEKKLFENYYNEVIFLSEVKYLYITEDNVTIINSNFEKTIF